MYNLIHTLLPEERRRNDYVEGFGLPPTTSNGAEWREDINAASAAHPHIIDHGHKRTVLFPLRSGLLIQPFFTFSIPSGIIVRA